MKNWIKRILGITQLENENKELREQLQSHRAYVGNKFDKLQSYITVDADIGWHRGRNTIVLTGVYRGKGFVKFYDVGEREFIHMVEYLQDMKKHALIRNLDAPPLFHGVFDLF